MTEVIVTTDGSVSGNGKPDAIGGWACILQAFKSEMASSDSDTLQVLLAEKEYSGKLVYETDNCPVTNIRAEQYGILKGLEEVCGRNCRIEVHSDSELCIKTLNGEYSRKTNQDLWERLDKRCMELKQRGCSIMFMWIKGHSTNVLNNRADKLAGKAKKVVLLNG